MPTKSENDLLGVTQDLVEEVRKIYNLHTPGRIEEAVTIVEEWINKQDHILKKDFDKDYLERAIITCKGSVEKAKKQIDKLCTFKTLLPQFFTVTNLKIELQELLKIAWVVPLPKLTKDLYRVIFVKIRDDSFTSKHFLHYYQYCIIICEYLKSHDYVNGYIVVDDYNDTSILDMTTKLNPVELQQFNSIMIEGYGARLKGLHIYSKSKTVDLFVRLIKPFFSQKIANRLQVHDTLEELYESVPKEIFPAEYGGTEKSLAELSTMWVDELSTPENVEYLKKMNKACTDETLRSSDKFNEEYMGMPGAFRNLYVD